MGSNAVRKSIAVAVSIIASVVAVASASAAPPDRPQSAATPTHDQTIAPSGAPYGNIPSDVYDLATHLNLKFHDASLTWDDAADSLTVWYSPGAEDSAIRATVAASGVNGVVVAQSTYARKDLSALADNLVQSGAISGQTVAWAGPLPDGSGLDVGVDVGVSARATQETSLDGVPVHVVASGEAVAASRDYDMTPFIAGADMLRDAGNGYVTECTTAFAFNHFDLTTHLNVEQLFTAEHCTANGAVWRTGSYLRNPTIGTAVGATTGGADISVISGQDYDPYMYYGANTSNSAVAIFGYVTPIVGGLVCYSGAPSGTVCDNKVTDTGLTVPYGGGLTYQDLTRTEQTAGVSAVGNGDSGGPAFVIDPQGYVYAAGIISGMESEGSSCQGDPAVSGGR